MRTLLPLLIALVVPHLAWGQPQNSARVPDGTTALTVGYLSVDFEFAPPEGDFVYRFQKPAAAFMLSSEKAQFSLAYGTTSADSNQIAPSIRVVDAALSSGGNWYLLRPSATLPVAAYVPIRLDLGHRYAAAFGGDLSSDELPEPVHLARAALSAGAGGSVRVPTSLPILEDHIVGIASLTFGLGATGDVQAGIDAPHLMRTRELHLQIKVEKLLNNIGGTIGYIHRTQKWDQEVVTNAGELLDKLDQGTDVEHMSRQHMFYLGINF